MNHNYSQFREDIFDYWKIDRRMFRPFPDNDYPATYKQHIVLSKALDKARKSLTEWANGRIDSSPEVLCLTAHRILLEKAAAYLDYKSDPIEFLALYRLTAWLFYQNDLGAEETAAERYLASNIMETYMKEIVPRANQELNIQIDPADEEDLFRTQDDDDDHDEDDDDYDVDDEE